MAVLDWSTLTDPLQALNLILKKEDTRDVYQKNNIFQAVALTDGYPLTAAEAKVMQASQVKAAPDDEEAKADEKKFFARVYFKGRILGPNSPHSFLPDPCDMNYAADPEPVQQAIAMHTTFVTTAEFKDDTAIQAGDIYTVSLRAGDDDTPFNLHIGDALKRTSAPKKKTKKEAEQCQSMIGLFSGEFSSYDADELQMIQQEGTSTDPDDLHPDFRPAVEALIAMMGAAGYKCNIQTTYRSAEAQIAAYELGRSEIAEGGSHSTTLDGEPASLSVDIINADGNGWLDTQANFDFFVKLGENAKLLGLTWGGDWDPATKTIDGKEYTIGWDPAHVEAKDYWGYVNT